MDEFDAVDDKFVDIDEEGSVSDVDEWAPIEGEETRTIGKNCNLYEIDYYY